MTDTPTPPTPPTPPSGGRGDLPTTFEPRPAVIVSPPQPNPRRVVFNSRRDYNEFRAEIDQIPFLRAVLAGFAPLVTGHTVSPGVARSVIPLVEVLNSRDLPVEVGPAEADELAEAWQELMSLHQSIRLGHDMMIGARTDPEDAIELAHRIRDLVAEPKMSGRP